MDRTGATQQPELQGTAAPSDDLPGTIERWQVLVYVTAILAGGWLGLRSPEAGSLLEGLLWPALGVLLFATFLQIPVGEIGAALRQRRFLGVLLGSNFVLVPLLVWSLSQLLPDDFSVRLAFFLVLLAPCTDWFNTFAHLGRGDGRLSLAATPLLLVVQMLLLPVLLALFLGDDAATGMRAGPFLRAFAAIIVAPLVLAVMIQAGARRWPATGRAVSRCRLAPIPLLACVLFIIAAASVHSVLSSLSELLRVAALFVAYLVIAPLLAVVTARTARLEAAATRTVVFSVGTRNSFVVLPLVLAWPGAGDLAVAVVVLQSLVELGGMMVYVAVVPRMIGRRCTPTPAQQG
jgi:ACR3 family arsenite transporter